MIYAIVGPTGVGKTKLSIELAKRIDAEIINCDSMQVYKELKIGVAKIKEQEKEGIAHHLFDIVSVDDEFNAFLYQEMGRKVIDDIEIIFGNLSIGVKPYVVFRDELMKDMERNPHIFKPLSGEKVNYEKDDER